MRFRHLDDALLRRLLDELVQLGVSREALLIGLTPGLKGTLPGHRTLRDNLWSDLNELNALGEIDGQVPLRIWLVNALDRAEPRGRGGVFREALAALGEQTKAATAEQGDGTERGSSRGPADGTGAPSARAANPYAHRFASTPPPDRHPGDRGDAPEVVVLHTQEDAAFAASLRTHVAVLTNTKKARFWFQGSATPGRVWREELRERFDRAAVVLVLISATFLASETLELVEEALAAGRRGIVPVVARPCDWQWTRLGALRPLPADDRAISQYSSPDEAYAKIAGELHELLRRLGSEGGAGKQAPVRPPPGQKHTLEEIFPESGLPGATYVTPVEHAEITRRLAIADRGLVVEGPSAIGKTTSITRALGQLGRKSQHLLPGDPAIDALARPEDVKGWVVLDDFHELEEGQKRRVAHLLKWMVDRPSRDRKLVLLGVGEVMRTLLALNTNLLGRVDSVRIKRQPDERVAELLAKGEAALNIRFDPRDVIVSLASGSFSLAQQLAAGAAGEAGTFATEGQTKRIEVSRSRLAGEMLARLRSLYSDPIVTLLSQDRGAPRGVYLALLWLLGQQEDEGIRVTDVTGRYPQFLPALDAAGEDALVEPLRRQRALFECLRVDGHRVTVVDPRLSFYLRNENVARLAREGGLDGVARIDDEGALEFRGPEHEVVATATGNAPMWAVRDADRFWWRRDVRALVALLSDAYGADVQGLLQIAHAASIGAAQVAFQGRAVADVARDIVDLARRRGTVKPLLEALRRDEQIRAYWKDLDEMLGIRVKEPAA